MNKRKVLIWALKQAAYAGVVYGASRLAVIGKAQEEARQAAIAETQRRHPSRYHERAGRGASAGYRGRPVQDNPQA